LLRDWRPDVLYCQGLSDPQFEAEALAIAPGVFYAHNYCTCISGAKTRKFPRPGPCPRQFGWQCLLQYYPRRCGGWNPLTMLSQFQLQANRIKLLSHYEAVLANSEYVAAEYRRHGVRAHCVHPFVNAPSADSLPGTAAGRSKPYWQLLFLGRMDLLKGGRVLLDALPIVRAGVDRDLKMVFAGDGPDREAWERRAARLQRSNSGLEIRFVGWVDGPALESLFSDSDLLVMPSLWPEPFGLAGPEAGLRCLPAVAFAVGGIRDWLQNGVNGFLAPGDPPRPEGLALAISQALDSSHYSRLRVAARRLAQSWAMEKHMTDLLRILESGVAHHTLSPTLHSISQVNSVR